MKPNPQTEEVLIVLKNVGTLLRYVSAVPLGLLPVVAAYREWHMLVPVLAMAAIFLVVGWLLGELPTRREPRLREGLLIAAVSWLLVPAGSVALFVLGEDWLLLDAYFEAMSAWTGTGMSVADVRALSQTTLFWRTLMQWVGGLGVIVLTLAVLARPGTGAYTLYVSEAREEKLKPSVLSTVRTLWRIYIVLSVAAVLLLLAVGLPPWHALNHGLTGIATGGMSITAGSIGEYADPRVEWTLIPIMIMGALPFVAIYALSRGRWRDFARDEQVRALFLILLVSVPLLAWALRAGILTDAVRAAAFQATSALTSAGFQTVAIVEWDAAAKMGLAGLMVLGGAAGSTAGGIKLFRAVLLVKGAMWKLRRSGLPAFAVTSFAFGGERLDEREANEEFAEAAFILILWVVALFTGLVVFLTLLPSVPFEDVAFELASAQSNIGLSVGIVSPALPAIAKAALVAVMWAGRLEILPVLLLLRAMLPGPSNR